MSKSDPLRLAGHVLDDSPVPMVQMVQRMMRRSSRGLERVWCFTCVAYHAARPHDWHDGYADCPVLGGFRLNAISNGLRWKSIGQRPETPKEKP